MQQIVYWNGNFIPKSDAHLSPDDRGFLFGDGVYEVVRSYHGKWFRRKEHLDRMAQGMRAIGIEGPAVDLLAEVCDTLLDRNGFTGGDAVVYLQVTRGAAPRTHYFPDPPVPATVYGTIGPFRPKGDPAVGIAVITVPDLRWTRCDIKTVGLLANCLANQQARDAGATDAVFVRDGIALEGTATSFFGLFGGVVRTAPTSNYILPSITRQVVLKLCAGLDIPVELVSIRAEELEHADEMFLAGTTMEIMPIVRLDNRPVSDGEPGAVTRKLQEEFWRLASGKR